MILRLNARNGANLKSGITAAPVDDPSKVGVALVEDARIYYSVPMGEFRMKVEVAGQKPIEIAIPGNVEQTVIDLPSR